MTEAAASTVQPGAAKSSGFFGLKDFLGAPGCREFLHARLFWALLLVKLVMASLLGSYYLRDLFIPFVNFFVESGFEDPWKHFSELDRLRSFPYPPVMLYVFAIPRWILGFLLPGGIDTVTWGHLLVMRLPLLAADLSMALILASWFPNRVDRVLKYYWASPLLIYVSYWHGQLDVIPTALLLISLALVRRARYDAGMIVLALALASKSHIVAIVPFLFVYLGGQIGWQQAVRRLVLCLGVYLLVLMPYAMRPGFQSMVFGSSEQGRVLAFRLLIGSSGLELALGPLAVILLWFRFESYTKQNWDLFLMYTGVLFAIFVSLAPPQPGYILWCLPFLIYFACHVPKPQLTALHVYLAFYLCFFWFGPESDLWSAWQVPFPRLAAWTSPHGWLLGIAGAEQLALLRHLLFTGMVGSLAALVVEMYREGVRSNQVYRMRQRPILIGLAGDSGAGKDTLADLLGKIFGSQRTLLISGDDYHRWPRGHEMWRVHTHLDVRANNLHQQQEHAVAIASGATILKGEYDHSTGLFTDEEAVDPHSFVIFAGLHALSLDLQRDAYELSIFLDPDEPLRRFWKVRRDGQERGHGREAVEKQLDDRAEDRERYVLPQQANADVVVRYCLARVLDETQLDGEPELRLELFIGNSFNLLPLVETLQRADGLEVSFEPFSSQGRQCIRIEGSVTPGELDAWSRELIPSVDEVSLSPRFEPDLNGCVQFVLLSCLSEKLRLQGDGLR